MITDLEDFLNLAWTHLVRGVKDRKHGFHQPVLATIENGKPKARTVVLRKVDREQGLIICHTDRRSGKVAQSPAGVEWCFYDYKSKLQVRAAATAEVLTQGPVFEERWNASRLASRRCYLAPHVPGTQVSEAHPNLPDELRERDPTQEESEAGKHNFAVFLTHIRSLDVLHLAHDGHSRAVWQLATDGATHDAAWVAP